MSRKSRRTRAHRRQLAATQPAVTTPLGIIGFGGSMFPWQWLWGTPHEYNPDLMGRAAQDVYARMMNDSQIRGIAAIINMPIRQARWRVKPGGDTTLDEEIRGFVEVNLLQEMATPWDDVLQQLISSEMFGYCLHEKEFALDGGQVHLAGLWDLLPNTIEKMLYRPNRRLDGIWQWGIDVDGRSRRAEIEAARLLITTSGGRGGSVAGAPLLRAMYAEWFIKHPLLKLMTVGLENSLVGTVWAKVPRSMTTDDRQKLRQAIEDLRVRDATGFVLDEQVVLDILEGKRNAMDALPLVEYLDNQMAKVALAQFLNLGTSSSGGGSRAVSEDHSRVFLIGENAIADRVAGNVNRNLIRQLVDFNWPGYGVYPLLDHDNITRMFNIASVGDALNKLMTGGALNWTEDVENAVRDWYDFNPLPDDFLPAKPVAPPLPAGPADPAAPADPARQVEAARRGLHLTTPAPHPSGCACGEARDPWQLAEPTEPWQAPLARQVGDDFQAQAGQLLHNMIAHLEASTRAALDTLGGAGPLEQSQVYTALVGVELPERASFHAALTGYFTDVVGAALAAAGEVQGAPAPELSTGLREWVAAQVDLLAHRLPDQLKYAFLQSLLHDAAADVTPAQLVSDAAQAARDRLNVDFRQCFTEALADLTTHAAIDLVGPDATDPGAPASAPATDLSA